MATELGKAYVQIVPSAQGISGSISSVLNPEADSAGESAGKKLGSKVVSLVKAAIVSGAIGKTFKDALLAGGDIEQSVGGVKKIFGDAAQSMINNAERAYKTAGISANMYMEQATSFSAALVSSLGGDTAKAAKVADMAIIDMADNVNTYGSNMQDVQNAYQGFAKQNYTMLDNLKLGYGGTKTEMERLLADAEKLTGVKYDINNLSDVYSAIHAIQQETHISGTTANEAAGTISGSIGMVKASLADLQGLMALSGNETAEEFGLSWTKALQNVIESMGTLGKNIIPALQSVASTLPTVLVEAVTAGLPMLVNGGLQIITSLVEGITNALPVLAQRGPEMVRSLLEGLITNVTLLLTAGIQLVQSLAEGISTGLPQLIAQAMPMILQFCQTLASMAPQLITAGIQLLLALITGITQCLPTLIEFVPQIVTTICNIVNDNFPMVLVAGVQLIVALIKGLIQALPSLASNFGNIIQALISAWMAVNWLNLGTTLITRIGSGVSSLASKIPELLKSIGSKAVNLFKGINWSGLGSGVLNTIHGGISSLFSKIPSTLKSIGSSAMSAFRGLSWGSIGSAIVNGIANGVSKAAGRLFSALRNLASRALSSAKAALKVGSPSRLFRDEVGKWIPAGMAEGIRSNMDAVRSEMDNLTNLASGTYTTDIMANAAMAAPAVATAGGGPVYNNTYNINVSGNETDSVRTLAIKIRDEIVKIEKRGY